MPTQYFYYLPCLFPIYMATKVYRVKASDLKAAERRGANGKDIVLVLNQNVRAVAPRTRKANRQQEEQPSNSPGWLPQAYRLWG